MITIEEAQEMLDELACELPQEFYGELNGGISLLPDTKLHPERRADDLYIMGEYVRDWRMGRYIIIYFGSFSTLYGHLPRDAFKKKLRETLRHEFTHHLESLAGERGLEIRDEEDMERYYTERE